MIIYVLLFRPKVFTFTWGKYLFGSSSEQFAQMRSEIVTDGMAWWCHWPHVSRTRKWTSEGLSCQRAGELGLHTPGPWFLLAFSGLTWLNGGRNYSNGGTDLDKVGGTVPILQVVKLGLGNTESRRHHGEESVVPGRRTGLVLETQCLCLLPSHYMRVLSTVFKRTQNRNLSST